MFRKYLLREITHNEMRGGERRERERKLDITSIHAKTRLPSPTPPLPTCKRV